MSVLVDIFGSCVCRDIFRHADKTKYEIRRCLGYIPVTTLTERRISVRKGALDKVKLTPYEKKMLRIQMRRNAPELLKKSEAKILVMDLADELMKRWKIESGVPGSIAVIEGKESEYEKIWGNTNSGKPAYYSPFELNMEQAEKRIKYFAEQIVRSDENPDGYEEKNIIVIESLCTADILGNDGIIHSHKSINAHQCNEFLRGLYRIFYKYVQNCKIVKMPELTHSSENHIRGLHPLHYMENTYEYFVKVIDILCGYSNVNSIQNLFKEYSLKNKLKTRTANSNVIYSIGGIKKRVDQLEKNEQPIKIDVFGSCVSRDIFRFAVPGRYEVCTNIERNSITSLYENSILEEIKVSNTKIPSYEQKMFTTQLKKDAVAELKRSGAEILVLDLAEERLDRYEIEYKGKKTSLNYWPRANIMFESLCNEKHYGCRLNKKKSPFEMTEKQIREKFSRFAKEIVKTEKNPDGYEQGNIYVIEAKFADKIVTEQGGLRNYYKDYHVKQYNQMYDQMYKIFYEYIPNCKKIKFPQFAYATEHHKWGGHPLHYEDKIYEYFLEVFEVFLGFNQKNTPENIYKEQALKNRLYTRVINSNDMYEMKQKINELEEKVNNLTKIFSSVSDVQVKE